MSTKKRNNAAVILFDWDNTLVDTWPIIHQALHDTFIEYDMEPWTIEQVKARVAHSMREAFPLLFGDKWQEVGKTYQNNYRKYNLQKLTAIKNAEDSLRYLKNREIDIAVVSNKRSDNLNTELSHIGWSSYFSAIVGSGDADRDKPSPDPIYKALENMGLSAQNNLFYYIGDSHIDLEASANSGAIPILYGEANSAEYKIHDAQDGSGLYNGHRFRYHVTNHQSLVKLFENIL